MDVREKCRKYVAAMPAAVSGSGGHDATFRAALVITRGFCLTGDDARRVMEEYNARCNPPWKPRDLEHKLTTAARSGAVEMGYLLKDKPQYEVAHTPAVAPRPARPEFDAAELERFNLQVDVFHFANRSAVDPATIGPRGFLELLYKKDAEKIIVFINTKSQGEAVWPLEKLPTRSADGVWFLCAPVDGKYRPNERAERDNKGRVRMSRRISECALRFPYMVFESDCVDAAKWLGLLAQLPLPIEAIYTSGGRSIHALIRVDARTTDEFNQIKNRMAPGLGYLVKCGLDWRAVTAMRLTRLPNCRRGSELQRLLFVRPNADCTPIKDLPPMRNAEVDWLASAACGISDADGGKELFWGLKFYTPFSEKISTTLKNLESGLNA